MLIDDQRLTFVEGTVRRSIGRALVEVGAARESNGGTAAHAQLLGKFGRVNVSAEALLANDFHLQGGATQSVRDVPRRARCAAQASAGPCFRRTPTCISPTARDGTQQLEAAARLSANFDRFNLATDLQYRKQYLRVGPGAARRAQPRPDRHRPRRRRAAARLEPTSTSRPRARFRTRRAVGLLVGVRERSIGKAALAYDAARAIARRARITHIRRLDTMALALTGEAATDGSVAVGFNLNFSLDPRHGFDLVAPAARRRRDRSTRPSIATSTTMACATRPSRSKKARWSPPARARSERTDRRQRARSRSAASPPITPVAGRHRRDQPRRSDAGAARRRCRWWCRGPASRPRCEIGLVGGGDIEGALVKSGELGFEGARPRAGRRGRQGRRAPRAPISTASSCSSASLTAATRSGSAQGLGGGGEDRRRSRRDASRSRADKSVVRLGAIQPRPAPRIAAAGVGRKRRSTTSALPIAKAQPPRTACHR